MTSPNLPQIPNSIQSARHLAVCGSRTLSDERVRIILLETIEALGVTEIVTHAEPEGVCLMAQQICKELAIPLKLHFLNFRYLRGAFEHRSKDVLRDCDACLFVHDGISKGTANELKLATRMKVPTILHTLEVTPYKSSVGFEIDTDWDISFDEWPEIDEENAKGKATTV